MPTILWCEPEMSYPRELLQFPLEGFWEHPFSVAEIQANPPGLARTKHGLVPAKSPLVSCELIKANEFFGLVESVKNHKEMPVEISAHSRHGEFAQGRAPK